MKRSSVDPGPARAGAGQNPPAERKMALLVDGDSAPADLAAEMIAEAAKYGPVVVRRVYGNWGSSTMNNWTKASRDLALESRHHTPAVSGKNSTDLELAMDAMELLCEGVMGGFCIVSSDSDFTGLATRLRAKGKLVLGIGLSQTPTTLQQACDTFVHIETLKAVKKADGRPRVTPKPAKAAAAAKAKRPPPEQRPASKTASAAGKPARPLAEALPLLKKAFEMTVTDEGFAHMSNFGSALHRLDASFDHRAFGKKQLSDLIEAFSKDFRVERPSVAGVGGVAVYRLKG